MIAPMSNRLTTRQAAEVLGVSRRTVLYLVERGELVPAERIEALRGALLFDLDTVEALAAERRAS